MWLADGRRVLRLALPILVGQLAAIGFALLDTLGLARTSAFDLAALALGSAIYVSIYLTLNGILQGLVPVAARHVGANRPGAVGEDFRQAVWLTAALITIGLALVLLGAKPLLALSGADGALQQRSADYLRWLAAGLPAALTLRLYAMLCNALGRPVQVTLLQLAAVAIKALLNEWLVFGGAGVPALGCLGAAFASIAANLVIAGIALWRLTRDPAFAPLQLFSGSWRPRTPALKELLALGVPVGGSYLFEVSAFTLMAVFIARFGTTVLGAHQIVANFETIVYMVPLAIALAAQTLVAQTLGAGDEAGARRLGLRILAGVAALHAGFALLLVGAPEWVLDAYGPPDAVAASARGLLRWIAVYQFFDALQLVSAFLLRAYKKAVVPMVVHGAALWGIGLGVGWLLGFNQFGPLPAPFSQAAGFWAAGTAGIGVAALALLGYWLRISRTR